MGEQNSQLCLCCSTAPTGGAETEAASALESAQPWAWPWSGAALVGARWVCDKVRSGGEEGSGHGEMWLVWALASWDTILFWPKGSGSLDGVWGERESLMVDQGYLGRQPRSEMAPESPTRPSYLSILGGGCTAGPQ